jgi:hypothetical protein
MLPRYRGARSGVSNYSTIQLRENDEKFNSRCPDVVLADVEKSISDR